EEKFEYLHRGTNTLALRLPKDESLQNLLKKTGPLIAPSANVEGLPPAKNITDAKKYFGDGVDLYIDGGEIEVVIGVDIDRRSRYHMKIFCLCPTFPKKYFKVLRLTNITVNI